MAATSQNLSTDTFFNRAALLPTAYCPPASCFLLMRSFKKVIIEVFETYPKQTWRNRCRIVTANGLLDLSIPVTKPSGNHTMTRDILVSNHLPWQQIHWKSLQAAYQKSPFFPYYAPQLATLFTDTFTGRLIEWNATVMHVLFDHIGIEVSIEATPSYEKNAEHLDAVDFRDVITPKGIWPEECTGFQWPPYHQVFIDKHGFLPDVSILDVLFNLGPDTKSYLDHAAGILWSQRAVG